MPPCGKALHGVGLKLQRQYARKARSRAGKRDGCEIARAQKRDDQKRYKEDNCRAEVVHQRQTAADCRRVADEQNQVPLCHQTLQGGRAREHKADFDQLRRLERNATKLHPVFRAEFFHAQHQICRQQQNAACRRQIADFLCPLQIAQTPADRQICENTACDGNQFLPDCLRRGG